MQRVPASGALAAAPALGSVVGAATVAVPPRTGGTRPDGSAFV
ncbi:hypothetical protein [Nocardia rhamnosiphila]|uniref:Uncharacterized protein n=1 Tax=Nocardia rhamnosiphila TaxID=426716 RepID=A0ABV2WZK9_9NOCA